MAAKETYGFDLMQSNKLLAAATGGMDGSTSLAGLDEPSTS